MLFRFSKLGIKYSLLYLALFLVAFIYAKLTISESPLSSIFIMILTFPWSYISIILLFVLNIIDTISTGTKLMMMLGYAIINTVILYYFIYKKFEKSKKAS